MKPSISLRAGVAGTTLVAVTVLAIWLMPVAAAQAPSPAPQPRLDPQGLTLLITPDPLAMNATLARVLAQDGRFHLAGTGNLRMTLKGPDMQLDPTLTVAARDQLRSRTPVRYLLVGRSQAAAEGGPGLAARVVDLALGEVGPLFEATGSTPAEVAQRTRRYLRTSHPLTGRVRDLRDGQLYIDLGTRSGLTRGSGVVIRRIVGIRQDTVALARVQRAEEWFSLCDIEERTTGMMPRIGDLVLEDVTRTLSRP